eukprot:gene21300-27065_t
MNYYSSVAPKVAMRLRQPENPEFSNDTQKYVINCCDFHGCKGTNNYKLCHPLNQQGDYSRSLEKFLQKQQHYETASHGKQYDIANFFERSFGYFYDPVAVTWGCAVREVLRARTGVKDYVRP